MRVPETLVALMMLAVAGLFDAGVAATPQPHTVEAVVVAPLAIEPQTLERAKSRADMVQVVRRLVEAATERAESSILRRARVSSPAASVPDSLSGVVRLPVALPDRLDHHRAQSRSEPFVTAVVILTGADGTVVGRADATLRWKDLRWTDHHWRGGGRTRRLHHHDRPVDDVLEQAVSEAVDRAVRSLAADAKDKGDTGAGEIPNCAS